MDMPKSERSGTAQAPQRPVPVHRLNDQSLKALLAASDAVMQGRRFTKDAAAVIRDAREECTAR